MSSAIGPLSLDIDRTEVPVLLVGPDHTVSYANRAAHALLGYAPNALLGLSLEWLSPPSRHGELRNIQSVFDGQTARRIRSAALCANGSVVNVTMTVEPCHDVERKVVAVSVSLAPMADSGTMQASDGATFSPHITGTMRKVPSLTAQPSNDARNHARSRTTAPPPPPSGARSVPPPAPTHSVLAKLVPMEREAIDDRMDSAMQLLRWLAGRLNTPIQTQSLDDPRERARALMVLDEARELLAHCQRDIREGRSDNR
jgi:PAS domain S-box-containing protein